VSQQINLYFEEARKAGKDLSALQMLQGAGLVAVAALVFYAYILYQTDTLELQMQAADASIAQQLGKLQQLSPADAQQQTALTLEQELKRAQADLAAQQKITSELTNGSIGSTRGYSEYMQAFARQVPGGLWLTGFDIEGDAAQMKLSGATLNPELLPVYIMHLNREKAMRGKSFAYLQMQQPKLEAGKPETAAYLEFVLQSAAAGEAERK